MQLVKLYKTRNGAVIDSSVKAPTPDAEYLGEFRRRYGYLPLVRVFTAASSAVAAAENLSFCQTKVGDSIGYATARAATDYADTFLTDHQKMRTDTAIALRRVKVRICAEDGDLLPETAPARLQAWAHGLHLSLKIGGVTSPIGAVSRCLDSHNVVTGATSEALTSAGVKTAMFQNGAGEGFHLAEPLVIKPGESFDVLGFIPAAIATAGSTVKVPVRVYLEGVIYEHLRS